MPRGRADSDRSQLSVVIPRAIHMDAKAKARRSGSPSFAAYVAAVLEAAPDQMTQAQAARAQAVERELKEHGGAR